MMIYVLPIEEHKGGLYNNIEHPSRLKICIEDGRLYIDTIKEREIMTGFQTVDEYLQNVENDKHVIMINGHGDMIAGDSAENILTNTYYYLVKDALVVRTADAADRLILYLYT